MGFLKNIFGKKEEAITNQESFWNWFKTDEKGIFDAIKKNSNLEQALFNKLSPKLNELRNGIFFSAGMLNHQVAELVLTAEGNLKNIAFIEDLVKAAPSLSNWKFTALKEPMPIENVNISMAGYQFTADSLFFYANEQQGYPDDIVITIVHNDYNKENKDTIINGSYVFLDYYLGELNLATTIDHIQFATKQEAKEELVPIIKLRDFLIWREKEFIEKYEGLRHNTEKDGYSSLEATLQNGMPLIALVNTTLLKWDSKASHPWILTISIKFAGNDYGMPEAPTYQQLNEFEDQLMEVLKDSDGYLNVGRETSDGLREVYFACKDFRKPVQTLEQLINVNGNNFEISFDIYKDKYWRTFDRFM